MKIEESIIRGLMTDEEFTRRVSPHIEKNFFQDRSEAMIVGEIIEFFAKFGTLPTKEILRVQIGQKTGISEDVYSNSLSLVDKIEPIEQNRDWLLEKTEKFCKDRSVYNAIVESLKIIEGSDKQRTPDAIPSILQNALSISFSNEVGHSYIGDAASRFEFYTRKEERLPFDLEILNKITNGGLPKKTLSMVLSESGGGKSLTMCHFAAANLRQGKNVLYITLELAEERIAERIDANLMGIEVNNIKNMSRDAYMTKIDNIAAKSHGNLFIKEYPPGVAHAGHFRSLLEELKVKKNFVPDIIYIDYLGICASARVKMGGSMNSYSYLKYVSEELRGLAVEFDVPVFSAGQVNRTGFATSDFDLTSISDSMGIVHTCDLILGMIRTEELDALGNTMIKQLKNRFGDLGYYTRFVVGINRAKMKLYDLEDFAQDGIQKEATFKPDIQTKTATKKISGEDFKF